MKASLVRFKFKNKLTIVVAVLLGVLAFYSTIMQVIYLIAKYLLDNESSQESDIDVIYNVEKKIVWPIIDFLMAIGILSIFYSIGASRRK
jgi:cytochrome c biogenesis protein CcdA